MERKSLTNYDYLATLVGMDEVTAQELDSLANQQFKNESQQMQIEDQEDSDFNQLLRIVEQIFLEFQIKPLENDVNQDPVSSLQDFLRTISLVVERIESQVMAQYSKGELFSHSQWEPEGEKEQTTPGLGPTSEKDFIRGMYGSILFSLLEQRHPDYVKLLMGLVDGEVEMLRHDLEMSFREVEEVLSAQEVVKEKAIIEEIQIYKSMASQKFQLILEQKMKDKFLQGSIEIPRCFLIYGFQKLDQIGATTSECLIEKKILENQQGLRKEEVLTLKGEWEGSYKKIKDTVKKFKKEPLKVQEMVLYLLRVLFLSNLPCNSKRFQAILALYKNVLEFGKQIGLEMTGVEETERAFLNFSIADANTQQKLAKEIVQEASQATTREIALFIYLAGSKFVKDESCLVKYQLIDPLERDILKTFLKFIYGREKALLAQQVIEALSVKNFLSNEKELSVALPTQKNAASQIHDFFHFSESSIDLSARLVAYQSQEELFYNSQELLMKYIHREGTQEQLEKEKIIAIKAIMKFRDAMKQSKHGGDILSCVLQKLSQHSGPSSNVVLAISGFLSQNSSPNKDWQGLSDYLKDTNSQVYAVCWESMEGSQLLKAIFMAVGKIAIETLINSLLAGKGEEALSVFKMLNKSNVLKKNLMHVKEVQRLFQRAIEHAKVTGVVLACALALRFPFRCQTIQVVAFSLGCQVLKTMLKTLHDIGAHHIIQQVTFLGGATRMKQEMKTKECQKLNLLFSETVNGGIKNVYTWKDFILLLFTISEVKWAIGRNKLYVSSKNNTKNQEASQDESSVLGELGFSFSNYDISSLMEITKSDKSTAGHFYYRKDLERVLRCIKFET